MFLSNLKRIKLFQTSKTEFFEEKNAFIFKIRRTLILFIVITFDFFFKFGKQNVSKRDKTLSTLSLLLLWRENIIYNSSLLQMCYIYLLSNKKLCDNLCSFIGKTSIFKTRTIKSLKEEETRGYSIKFS